MDKLFTRLRRRLTLVCTAATGIILVGMTLASLAVAQRQLGEGAAASFQSEVNAVLFHLRGQSAVDHTWLAQTEAGGGLLVYLELSGTPLLYRGAGDGQEREALVALAREKALQEFGLDISRRPDSRILSRQEFFSLRDAGGVGYRAAAASIPLENGWAGLLILRSTAAETAELRGLRLAFGGFAALAICLLAAFSWMFAGRMLAPLEASRRRQAEFVHAASHELRSPLAVIHACLSAIRGAPPEKAEHFTQVADGECLRMSRLVGDMLTLAGADGGTWTVEPGEAEPETLLLGVYECFEGPARERGIALAVSLPEAPLPRCRWDAQRISQVLSALTDNALSHTPAGGTVDLSVGPCPEGVVFTVADTGPGIPPEQRERIFERFYRGDAARTDREHYGLGLSIAAEIVSLHRGRIGITETPGGGATFAVVLPGGEQRTAPFPASP